MIKRFERRILQITASPFPPAIRVVKEGLSLVDAGYQCAVICPPIEDRPEQEVWRGISIYRPESLRRAAKVGDKIIFHTMFFSPAWFKAISEVIAEYNPDVIHVHDIWLARTAFLARKDQKVVIDLHENMPAAVVEYRKSFRGLFKWFYVVFHTHNRVARYERALLAKSDKVFVVVEEALRRVLHEHPYLTCKRVVSIENLESKQFLNYNIEMIDVIDKNYFSVLYIGGLGPHRGIDTVILAMRYIKKWGLNVKFYLVGAKESVYLTMLKDLVNKTDVASHVTIIGWVPANMVLSYIFSASVGTVPHHTNPHTDNTIPHKLYQYMIAKKPVLVSSSDPLARTVLAAKAGAIFKAGDAIDCANKIKDMYDNPSLLSKYATNGFNYVMKDGHNWENESAPVLISAYDELFDIS